jgi:sporulation protein YlmC with PRC-barrel domain
MLRGISDLKRFTIAATDGQLGSVSDLYFDDSSWAVRYLVVDGPWLPSRRLCVSPISVQRSGPTTLRLGSSIRQVAVSSDNPAQPDEALPERLVRPGDGGGCHLQAATAVIGYAIRAEDGEIGHVKDILVDDKAWAIRYLVVDTEHWWAGRTVLVSPGWLTRVAWDESKTLCCIATAGGDTEVAGRPVSGGRPYYNAGFTPASDRDPLITSPFSKVVRTRRPTVPAELAENHPGFPRVV